MKCSFHRQLSKLTIILIILFSEEKDSQDEKKKKYSQNLQIVQGPEIISSTANKNNSNLKIVNGIEDKK